jgi:hypothetical protein
MQMKKFTLCALMASLLAVPVAKAADEEDHSAHHPAADQGQSAPAPDDKAAGMKMGGMQETMKKMQTLMAKIHSTTDPKEREKLLKEHMQAMRESMKMMSGMMDMGGMMGGKKKRKDAGAEQDAHQHGDDASSGSSSGGGQDGDMMMGGMMMMHKKMEARMDAMQKMMEQIIEREAVEQDMQGK